MKYLKKFETHAEYAAYISGNDAILPNVSYCEDNNDVHYNPWVETRLVAKFNVEDDSDTTLIYGGMEYGDISALDNLTKIEVDGVEISLTDLDENYGYYQLSEGEHTIRYTLVDSTEIGELMFGGCFNMTSITIPDSVTAIGNRAFSYCTNLTSITIGNSVTTIGRSAFDGCSGLTSIVVDSGNTVYDSRNNCNAIIETVSNTLIAGCKNTVIPNTITTIGNSAFYGCTGLTSITIPNSVTTIGESSFFSCTSLTSITIPNSVTSIGQNAFNGCTGLTSITSLTTTAPTIQNTTFRYIKSGGTLYVPTGSTGYDVWMGTGDYYLGKYSWTKVEQ